MCNDRKGGGVEGRRMRPASLPDSCVHTFRTDLSCPAEQTTPPLISRGSRIICDCFRDALAKVAIIKYFSSRSKRGITASVGLPIAAVDATLAALCWQLALCLLALCLLALCPFTTEPHRIGLSGTHAILPSSLRNRRCIVTANDGLWA